MDTKFIGVKQFRNNLTNIWKEAQRDNTRFVVMHHSTPVLEVKPIDDNKVFNSDKSYYINLARPILKKYKIKHAELFGSYARDEATQWSDIDIIVKMPKGSSLFDLTRLKDELGEALGIKVDLVTYDGFSKKIKPYIEKDLIRVI